jgi:DeoR/GlpR family transcriptional regulator of sugar metabolism
MIAARVELATKRVAENPDVDVGALVERCGVSAYTISRLRRASGA